MNVGRCFGNAPYGLTGNIWGEVGGEKEGVLIAEVLYKIGYKCR